LSTYETAAGKIIKKYNEGYEKAAKNNGFTVIYEGFKEIGPFSGGIFGRMTHVFSAAGFPEILAQTDIIVYTAHGLFKAVLVDPLKCHVGVLVDTPIPSTLYVKDIRDSMQKKPTWVPYHKDTKPEDVFKDKMGWNSLVDKLNQDGPLRGLLGKFKVDKTIPGIDQNMVSGRSRYLSVRVHDKEDNHNNVCQVVPKGDRSLIATEHVTEKPKDIEPVLKTVKRLIQLIKGYGHSEPSDGPSIGDYTDDLMEAIDKQVPAAPKVQTRPAPPVVAGVTCQSCGVSNRSGQKFCGECGSPLEQKKGVCAKCGAENGPDQKFCGECGNGLGEAPAAKAPLADESDSLAVALSEVPQGRAGKWVAHFKTDKSEYDVPFWNMVNEGWLMDIVSFQGLSEMVKRRDNFQIFSFLRYVKTPAGKALSGGWMDLVAMFNGRAPVHLRNKTIHVIVIQRDDNENSPLLIVASSEQDLTYERFEETMDILIRKPGMVEKFIIYGPND